MTRLGLLHGLPEKIGQILSMAGAEDSHTSQEASQSSACSMTCTEALAEVERRLGISAATAFQQFSPEGIAASIGQVHKAVLRDGRVVAVKVQHPGLADAVSFDLKALGWLSAPVGDLRRGFSVEAYRSEIGRSLGRELDFRTEAAALQRFTGLCMALNGRVLTPKLVPELSGQSVLTTTWVDGFPIPAARDWPYDDRLAASQTLVDLFVQSAFTWGFVHADPNFGNVRLLRAHGPAKIAVLDFGCMAELSGQTRSGLCGLVHSAVHGRVSEATSFESWVRLGFHESSLDRMRDRLPQLTSILTEPFLHKGSFDVRSWRLGERLSEALGPERLGFRTAGPPSLLFFIRAFQGLLRHLAVLDAPVNWNHCDAVRELADTTPLREPPRVVHDPLPNGCLSSALRVNVTSGGSTIVDLTFDASAAGNLSSIIPEKTLNQIHSRGIDLPGVSREARNGSYAPGELFAFADGAKSVRVWLE